MLELLYLTYFVIAGVVLARAQKMQRVTLSLGRYLSLGNELAGKTGFQDAIAPRSQNISNNLLLGSFGLFIAGFFFLKWYVPVAGLLVMFVIIIGGMVVAKRRGSEPLLPYVGRIVADLARRSADFKKKGDDERSQAAKDMTKLIEEAIDELMRVYGESPTVDDLDEALATASS